MNRKTLVFLAFVLSFGATAMLAGNTDGLGAKGLWDTVSGWLNDTYMRRIIALLFFCVGIWRAFAGSILQFFLMLGFTIVISQGNSIIEALHGGLF